MSWWWQPLEAAAQQQAGGGPAFDPATAVGAYQGNLEDSRPQWDQWQLLDPPQSKPDQLSPPNPPPYNPATQCEVLYDHRDLWPWATWQLLDEACYRPTVPAPLTILYLTSDFESETSEFNYKLRTFRSIDGNGVLVGEVVDTPTDQTELKKQGTAKSLRWLSPPIAVAVEINGPVWLNGWFEEDSAAANTAINLIDHGPTIFDQENSFQGEFDVGPTRTLRQAVHLSKDTGSRTLNRGQRLFVRVDLGHSTDGAQPATFRATMGYGGLTPNADGDAWIGYPALIQFQADPTPAERASTLIEQPQLPWARWTLDPDPGAEAPFQPPAVGFDPSIYDWQEQPQLPWQTWTMGPELGAAPIYPFHPGDGHFDWSEQPPVAWIRWSLDPDLSVEAPFQPPPFDPSTGFPWHVEYGDPWLRWQLLDEAEYRYPVPRAGTRLYLRSSVSDIVTPGADNRELLTTPGSSVETATASSAGSPFQSASGDLSWYSRPFVSDQLADPGNVLWGPMIVNGWVAEADPTDNTALGAAYGGSINGPVFGLQSDQDDEEMPSGTRAPVQFVAYLELADPSAPRALRFVISLKLDSPTNPALIPSTPNATLAFNGGTPGADGDTWIELPFDITFLPYPDVSTRPPYINDQSSPVVWRQDKLLDPLEGLAFQPPAPPFDPSTGYPWHVEYGDPWRDWRSPDIREAHFAGNLASWLFTPGSPGGGTGTAPPVLIDAESGDVYLYLGGVLIAPAR